MKLAKYLKTGLKKKTDFRNLLKLTTILRWIDIEGENSNAVIELTEKDLKKLPALLKLRKNRCKDLGCYFVHLSPDVSIFVTGNKRRLSK